MDAIQIKPIGKVNSSDKGFSIQLDTEYVDALKNLDGFSHLQIIWWGHLCDAAKERSNLVLEGLFKKGPDKVGVFATRAPSRPNPILISVIEVTAIHYDKGVIKTPFIDAAEGTPVLDIKPYHPMMRVKNVKAPNWCKHWPKWYEDTKAFNWQAEINF